MPDLIDDMTPFKKPILVTGSHKSGTTWVGRMIGASREVGYIQEPFNPTFFQREPGKYHAQFDCWYKYITDENGPEYYQDLNKTITFQYHLSRQFRTLKSFRAFKFLPQMLRNYRESKRYRRSNVRPLIKDPIAFFSADWLFRRFDMQVIVLIRHPAAFASSLKKNNWKIGYGEFFKQPVLIRDFLYPFEEKIKAYASHEYDMIDHAILFWKIIHHVILNYQEKHRNWLFMRHEDISRDPISQFQKIYHALHLDFSGKVRETIFEYTNPFNPKEVLEGNFTPRDSRANIWNWKTRLTPEEIRRIKTGVADISKHFYSDDEW